MPLQPDPPFPKTRGHAIRSKDWNDTVNEVARLDLAKLNQTGGTLSGNLAVTGNLSASGTVSGSLAANIVGPNQLAANAVTTAKIADGNVTNSKLAAGSVSPDKIQANALPVNQLLGYVGAQPFTLTLDGTVGAQTLLWMGQGPTAIPPFVSQPLVFIASPTERAQFEYIFEFRTTTDFDGGPVGGNMIKFTNRTAIRTQITVSSFLLRLG